MGGKHDANSTVVGSVTHVTVTFDDPTVTISAGDLTANGSPNHNIIARFQNASTAGVLEGTLSIDSNDADSATTDVTLQVEILTERRPAEAEVWMLYED